MRFSLRKLFACFGVFFFLFSNGAFALDQALVEGIYAPPAQAGAARSLRPASIKVLQWNVHMYETAAEERWTCASAQLDDLDLCIALADSDLALIQEARHAGAWRDRSDAVLGLHEKHLAFAPYAVDVSGRSQENYFVPLREKLERGLIVRDSSRTGSATFSSVPPLSAAVKLSQNADNFWPYYMPVIATTYALAGRAERLLVVHIHNLAGVGSDRQLELLDEAERLIAAHSGPVIFGGDFNSATREKMENLSRLARRQGLAEIPYHSPFPSPFGDRQLDHTYTRGLYLVAGSVRVFENSNRLSDHRAVVFELAVAP